MTPTHAQELAVLQAVTYASLFDYPLTLAQLRDSLVEVSADEATLALWCRTSALLQAAVGHRDGLYFPAGRADLVGTRRRREALSHDLLHGDRRMLNVVTRMPFVRMVALSGSLAHLNAERTADIDLFVITSANRVWLVTVAVLVISKALGWRKRLCLNYVISERRMAITPTDLFTANQIIHLRPISGEGLYQRFLDANPFVSRCYPNFRLRDQGSAGADRGSGIGDQGSGIGDQGSGIGDRGSGIGDQGSGIGDQGSGIGDQGSGALERVLSLGVAQVAERVCRALYRWHLRRRSARWRSRDQVRLEDECLKLHTSSHRAETMARFDAAMLAALVPPPARADDLSALARLTGRSPR